jgi:ethanolamine utilization microcompartment shell protein EutL
MPRPSEEVIDCIAAEAADDLRRLAGIWTRAGPAALDATVRTDVGLAFAILDAPAAEGVIRLIALRRAARAVLLTFAQARDGTRGIVASGLEPYYRV